MHSNIVFYLRNVIVDQARGRGRWGRISRFTAIDPVDFLKSDRTTGSMLPLQILPSDGV